MKKIIIQNLIVAFSFFSILFIVGLITLLLTKDFKNEEIVSTAKFCSITTLGLTIFMIVYQILFIRKNKISINDFDIRPKQTTTITIDKNIEETRRIIENIIPTKIYSSRFKYNEVRYSPIFVQKVG